MPKPEISEIALGGRFPGTPSPRPSGPGKPRRTRSGGLREGEFVAPGGKIVPDRPWLTPLATAFLERVIRPDSRILETGAGGSTIWFSRRAESVTTYEQDLRWFRCIEAEIKKRKILNVNLIYDPDYPTRGIKEATESFDLLFVDGRGRVKTIRTALDSVRRGGWILLDNSERERYHPGIEELDAKFTTKEIFMDGWEAMAWRKE